MKTERKTGTYELQVNLDGSGYDHNEGVYATLEEGIAAIKESYQVNKRFWPDETQAHVTVNLAKIVQAEDTEESFGIDRDEIVASYQTAIAQNKSTRKPTWNEETLTTEDEDCYKQGF